MEEGNSSPLQAESIRSPMNAASPVSMVIGTPEPEVKISPLIFPLKEETVKSESKKKKARYVHWIVFNDTNQHVCFFL